MARETMISMSVNPRWRLRSPGLPAGGCASIIDLHAAADPIDDDVILASARRQSHTSARGGAVGIEADAAGASIDQLLGGGVEADADPLGDRPAARPGELDGAMIEIDGD